MEEKEQISYQENSILTKARKIYKKSIKASIALFLFCLGYSHIKTKEDYTGMREYSDGSIVHIHKYMPWEKENIIFESRSCVVCQYSEHRAHDLWTIDQEIRREGVIPPGRWTSSNEHLVVTEKICASCLCGVTSREIEPCSYTVTTDGIYDYYTCKKCGKTHILEHIDYGKKKIDSIPKSLEEPKVLRFKPKK